MPTADTKRQLRALMAAEDTWARRLRRARKRERALYVDRMLTIARRIDALRAELKQEPH
jgi:hypothetical protein